MNGFAGVSSEDDVRIRQTFGTEPSSEVHAFQNSHPLIDVQIHTFVPVAAESIFTKEPTLRHGAKVVLVQEFARVPLFA
jgi:hypothetical protein